MIVKKSVVGSRGQSTNMITSMPSKVVSGVQINAYILHTGKDKGNLLQFYDEVDTSVQIE